MLDPVATYDCLFIGCRLQKRFCAFAAAEVHLLAYLACLLSLYKRSPIADWGYSFVGTEFGAPYSKEIDNALQGIQDRILFQERNGLLAATQEAFSELEFLGGLSFYSERTECLTGACGSVLAFSVGTVRERLHYKAPRC
jgi:hypothetical protein